jgi:anthranilate synthase component 1
VKALSYEQYQRLSQAGGSVPVFREIPGDLLTPVSAFRAFAQGSAHAFLLESVVGGERLARYSFLGRDPEARVEARGGGAVVVRDAAGERTEKKALLPAIRERLDPRTAEVPGLPRFTGGAVGYLGYDAVRLFERIPDRHPPASLPLASFAFYRSLVAFDHVAQRLVLIANAAPGSREAFAKAEECLDGMETDLQRPPAARSTSGKTVGSGGTLMHGASYRDAVRKAKEYIGIGDIFQVVLSRQAVVACEVDPFAVYRALRMVNPSPYMFFLRDGETAVAGASPEMLVRVENGGVETRPIAGTRPRGSTPEEDERLAAELLADAKERAEHLMLVDLGRNDLGRVCRFGSVAVPEFMKIERYSHVAHIVSSVTGELGEGKDALDALAAAFPAGTLSGAPKIRAMEIIDELEPTRRGLYGGGIGYVDLRGNLDFCITIRTVVLREGKAYVQAGAGIVADSDPAAEERETEAKAGAVFEALRLAEGLRS